MKPQPRKIENNQKAMIHAVAKELGIDHKDVLWKMFKVRSCLDISYLQAEKVRAHYKSLGWKPKRKKSPSPQRGEGAKKRIRRPQGKNVVYLANTGQKWRIIYLSRDVGWEDEDKLSIRDISPRLRGFVQRQTQGKKSSLNRLTSDEASGIIDALKDMVRGGRGERRRSEGE